MSYEDALSYARSSPPVRGAWIETPDRPLSDAAESPPVRGAWIETDPFDLCKSVNNCRLP